MLLLGVAGAVYFAYCVFNSKRKSIRLAAFEIISIFTSLFMIFGGLFMIAYDNSILGFGQNKLLSHIDINVTNENSEQSSVLFLLDELQGEATPVIVEKTLNQPYRVEKDNQYRMVFKYPNYTLYRLSADQISFTFNKKGTKILSISWVSKDLPNDEDYKAVLDYLVNDILGDPVDVKQNEVSWRGYSLMIREWLNGQYRIYLQRNF